MVCVLYASFVLSAFPIPREAIITGGYKSAEQSERDSPYYGVIPPGSAPGASPVPTQQPGQPAPAPGSAQAAQLANAQYREAQANNVPIPGTYDRALYDTRQMAAQQQAQNDSALRDRYAREAAIKAMNRPGYSQESAIGDINTQKRVLAGENMGDVLNAQLETAYKTPDTRDDQFFLNELQKWNHNAIETSSAYHHIGMDSGVPIPANPYEKLGDAALELEKGKGGLQETSWTIARATEQLLAQNGTTIRPETKALSFVNNVGNVPDPFVSPAKVSSKTTEPTGALPFVGVVPVLSPIIASFQKPVIEETHVGRRQDERTPAAIMAGRDTFKYKLATGVDKLDTAPWVPSKGKILGEPVPVGKPTLIGDPYPVGEPIIETSINEQGEMVTTTSQQMQQDVQQEYVQNVQEYDVSKVSVIPQITTTTRGNSKLDQKVQSIMADPAKSKNVYERSGEYAEQITGRTSKEWHPAQDLFGEKTGKNVEGALKVVSSAIPTSTEWQKQTYTNIREDPLVGAPMAAASIVFMGLSKGGKALGVGSKILTPATKGGKVYNYALGGVKAGLGIALADYGTKEVTGSSLVDMTVNDIKYAATGGKSEHTYEMVQKNFPGWDTSAKNANRVELELAAAAGAWIGADYAISSARPLAGYAYRSAVKTPGVVSDTVWSARQRAAGTTRLQTRGGAGAADSDVVIGSEGKYADATPGKAQARLISRQPEAEFTPEQSVPIDERLARDAIRDDVLMTRYSREPALTTEPGIPADEIIARRAITDDLVKTKMVRGSGEFTPEQGIPINERLATDALKNDVIVTKTAKAGQTGWGKYSTERSVPIDERLATGALRDDLYVTRVTESYRTKYPLSEILENRVQTVVPEPAVAKPYMDAPDTSALNKLFTASLSEAQTVIPVAGSTPVGVTSSQRLTFSPSIGDPVLFGTPKTVATTDSSKSSMKLARASPALTVLTKSPTETQGKFSISPAAGAVALFGMAKLAKKSQLTDVSTKSITSDGAMTLFDTSPITSPATITSQKTGLTRITGTRTSFDRTHEPTVITKQIVTPVPVPPILPVPWLPSGSGSATPGTRKRHGSFTEVFNVGLDMSVKPRARAPARKVKASPVKKKAPAKKRRVVRKK